MVTSVLSTVNRPDCVLPGEGREDDIYVEWEEEIYRSIMYFCFKISFFL